MKLKTSRDKTYSIQWADIASTGELFFQMADERKLSTIAREFEGLEWLKREDENQGDKLFEGYTNLVSIRRTGPDVLLMLMKGGD